MHVGMSCPVSPNDPDILDVWHNGGEIRVRDNSVYIRKKNSRKGTWKYIVDEICSVRETFDTVDKFVGLEFLVKWRGARVLTWEAAASLIEHGWIDSLAMVVADRSKHAPALHRLA